MSGNLNKILCIKKGWITRTPANIKDKGARLKEESIIILKTVLVEFIWNINSSSTSTTLVLSFSFTELFASLPLLVEVDITLELDNLSFLKILD